MLPTGSPSLPQNATGAAPDDDDPIWLFLCWKRQSCDECISLSDEVDCSWCPFSSTCIPNPSPKLPFLAPITKPDICPLGARERWELRSRPLGCNVSTVTFLTAVVAVFASFTLLALLVLLFRLGWKISRWWKDGKWRATSSDWFSRSRLLTRWGKRRTPNLVDDDATRDEEGGPIQGTSDGDVIDESSPLLSTNT